MSRESLRLTWIAGIVSLAAAVTASADCLFVNTNSIPNTVAAFSVAPNGTLTAVPGSPFATGDDGGFTADVGAIALLPAARRLYVSNGAGAGFADATRPGGGAAPQGQSDTVSGFDINSDCTLTTISGSPWTAGDASVGLAASPDGSRLYVGNFFGDNVTVFGIAADGSLSPLGVSPQPVASTPLDLQMSADGSLLFVSHDGPGAVGVYAVAGDGSLSPVSGSPFPTSGNSEHGLTLDPAQAHLWVADEGTETVSGFSIGSGGVLTPTPGSPYGVGFAPIEVLTNPTGNVLFVANNLDNDLSVFAIAGDGSLSEIGGSPFPSDSTGPAGLVTDPTGAHLFVANGGFIGKSPSGTDDVSVFSIAANGALTPIAGSPFATGGNRGGAMGVAYLSFGPSNIPTLGGAGLALLTALLAASAVALLVRRRARA